MLLTGKRRVLPVQARLRRLMTVQQAWNSDRHLLKGPCSLQGRLLESQQCPDLTLFTSNTVQSNQ